MGIQKLIAKYVGYNEWANLRFLNWLEGFDSLLINETVNSSFTSINETLQHLTLSQKFWHNFILQDEDPNFVWQMKKISTEEVFAEFRQITIQLTKLITNLSEEALESELHLKNAWSDCTKARYEFIIHVVNHNTYHRGQLVTIARGLGLNTNIPNTDYNGYNPS